MNLLLQITVAYMHIYTIHYIYNIHNFLCTKKNVTYDESHVIKDNWSTQFLATVF